MIYVPDVKVTPKGTRRRGVVDSLGQLIQEHTRCIRIWPEWWAQNVRRGVLPAFVRIVHAICADCGRQGLAEDANATFTSGLHCLRGATTHHMHYIQWTIHLSMQNFDRYNIRSIATRGRSVFFFFSFFWVLGRKWPTWTYARCGSLNVLRAGWFTGHERPIKFLAYRSNDLLRHRYDISKRDCVSFSRWKLFQEFLNRRQVNLMSNLCVDTSTIFSNETAYFFLVRNFWTEDKSI